MLFWIYRFAAFIVCRLPLPVAYWLLLRICDSIYFRNHRGRAAVRENLRIVFESQGIVPSRQVLDGCARKTFQYFGKYLADFIRFRKQDPQSIRELVSIQGMEHLDAIRDSKRGAILLTAHYGNWELAGAFVTSMGIPLSAVVRPVPSVPLERMFQRFRNQRGIQIIPLANAAIGVAKALRRGEIVALVGDRDFSGNGTPHTFFGRETTLPRGPAWFSHRLNVPIVMGFVSRAPDDTFFLHIYPPIDPAQHPTEAEIQEKIATTMQENIARDPCQWFIFDPFW